jgi:hypothetical protein
MRKNVKFWCNLVFSLDLVGSYYETEYHFKEESTEAVALTRLAIY